MGVNSVTCCAAGPALLSAVAIATARDVGTRLTLQPKARLQPGRIQAHKEILNSGALGIVLSCPSNCADIRKGPARLSLAEDGHLISAPRPVPP